MKIAFLALFFLVHGGSTSSSAEEIPPLHQELYSQARSDFGKASFHKPAPEFENELTAKFAPLIIQESSSDGEFSESSAFGAVALQNEKVTVQPVPTVYAHIDNVKLYERDHLRFSYLWVYAGEHDRNPVLQGVRITMDSTGQPVLWEALNRQAGVELLFAGAALEKAAQEDHGKPLEGRQHTLERDLSHNPAAIVARILEDGPVPMGPMVYVRKDPSRIMTIACRCMPAQVKTLLKTETYQVWNFSEAEPLLKAIRNEKVAFWPGEDTKPPRIQKLLRLPKEF